MVNEALDELFEEVEGEDEQPEEEGLQKDGLVERPGFGATAEFHHLADEDDLTDNESVDDGEGVVEGIGIVILAQEKYRVGGEGAEEDSQVSGDDGVVL